jgi:stage III sporulation protein AA
LEGQNVGVVDERSEIGGSCKGIPQNDLGIRTDLLDGCPKAEGIWLLLRSMAPQVLAVDEIGGEEDILALQTAVSCGCTLLATAHGRDMEDLKRKPMFSKLVEEEVFERYVFLDDMGGPGRIRSIRTMEEGRKKKFC